jgi:hypothetical protein
MSKQSKRVASAFEIPEPQLPELPTHLLAIDPGITHCGIANFEYTVHGGWTVQAVHDVKPLDLLSRLRDFIDFCDRLERSGVITIEGYQLYPGKMQQQGMSRMGTPETIGAVKWLYLDECWVGWRSAERPQVRVALYEQGASIKQHGCMAMEQLNSRAVEDGPHCHRQEGKGWVHDSPLHQGKNPHMRDAESHGWYRIKILEALRRKEEANAH